MTPKGLRYDNQYFFANEMDQFGYVSRAKKSKNGFHVEIGYQWRHPEQIWFKDPTSGEWYPAVNTDPEVIRKRCCYMELEAFRRKREDAILNTRSESGDLEDRAAKIIAKTLTNARKLTKQAKQDRNKSKNNVNEMTGIGRDAERLEKLNRDLVRFTPGIPEDMPETSESHSKEDQERIADINASSNDVWEKGRKREGN
jgi:hypothetical protein